MIGRKRAPFVRRAERPARTPGPLVGCSVGQECFGLARINHPGAQGVPAARRSQLKVCHAVLAGRTIVDLRLAGFFEMTPCSTGGAMLRLRVRDAVIRESQSGASPWFAWHFPKPTSGR